MREQEVTALAHSLMQAHGLHLQGWRFALDNAVRRFGQCNHQKRTITVSRKLAAVNSEARMRNTLLHEIAHALVGPGHGHNSTWHARAVAIGCDGQRAVDSGAAVKVTPQAVGTCPRCGLEIRRHRRARLGCRACGVATGAFTSFIWQ